MKALFNTSVGKKFLVGLTGIGVAGFSLIHVSGNMLLFVGPEAFNAYAYKLTSTPLLYVAEAMLAALFIAHFSLTFWLAWGNWKARPVRPYMWARGEKSVSCASRTMVYSGALVLVFLVLHIMNFRFGVHYSATYDGIEMRDLYRLVVECFQSPYFVGWYALCLVVLGMHLTHGISSVFQSVGIASARLLTLKRLAYAFVVIVIGGFLSQALIFYFFLGGKIA